MIHWSSDPKRAFFMFNRLATISLRKPIGIFLLLTASVFQASAQGDMAQVDIFNPLAKLLPRPIERFQPGGPAEETVEEKTNEKPSEKPVIYLRYAKKLSAAYEGFAIELLSAERPLLQGNPIFKKFGGIVFDRTEDGKYAYVIMVPFSSKKSVESFLENVVKPKAPGAKIVTFKNGKRHG